ncbi:hypothetical protein EPI10_025390 [Gossypium australe]|uniref:Uncharacterized protein n=1 Tax=Gossypium australe TaxID=47621 RepID=A0A5B6W1W2_9ROSI|nr:hypothetical protein EPI10_025390 [Gossypium australe]
MKSVSTILRLQSYVMCKRKMKAYMTCSKMGNSQKEEEAYIWNNNILKTKEMVEMRYKEMTHYQSDG